MNFIRKYKFFCLFIYGLGPNLCLSNKWFRRECMIRALSLVYNQQWRLSCHKTVKKCASAQFLEVLHDGRQVCVFKFSSENVERMKIENSIFIQILCIGYFWLISVIRTQQSVVHGNRQSRLNCAETRHRHLWRMKGLNWKHFAGFLPLGTDIRHVRGRGHRNVPTSGYLSNIEAPGNDIR